MAGGICYGDTVNLFNEHSYDTAGGYLDCNGQTTYSEGRYVVATAKTATRDGASGTWRIDSSNGATAGTPVKVGDTVMLLNMLGGAGGYLGVYDDPVHRASEGYHVCTIDRAKSSTQDRLEWKIVKDKTADGTPLQDGDVFHLLSSFQGDGGYLDIYERSALPGAVYNVYTSPNPDRAGTGTGSWKVTKVAAAVNPDTEVGNGTFKLPPHIKFGVTGLANSSSEQTVTVYIDKAAQAHTLQGKGVDDGNMGTVVFDSGNGDVRIGVTVNGKASKIASRQVSVQASDGKPVFFGLVTSEEGTDNDYNDAIVVLNWPLG